MFMYLELIIVRITEPKYEGHDLHSISTIHNQKQKHRATSPPSYQQSGSRFLGNVSDPNGFLHVA